MTLSTGNPAGFLGNRDQQKTAYGLLAVTWGIVAAAKIFATEQFVGHVFGLTAGQGLLGLQRLAGFSSLAPAVAAYTLAVAPSYLPPPPLLRFPLLSRPPPPPRPPFPCHTHMRKWQIVVSRVTNVKLCPYDCMLCQKNTLWHKHLCITPVQVLVQYDTRTSFTGAEMQHHACAYKLTCPHMSNS